MRKLSASALATYLKSPKQFYWRYVAQLEPVQLQVATFDHDKIFGIEWAAFVDRFYKGVTEKQNLDTTMANWLEKTDGWVPEKARLRLTTALNTLAPQYYQLFSPDDGCRTAKLSEMRIENERFVGILDGLSDDGIVHEVKTTSRSPSLSDQLWRVQNSIQVKLYCVMVKAKGHCIEFAWKDSPNQIFRGPTVFVSEKQRETWERELNAIADKIYSLGDNPDNYPCHPDGCCLVSKGMVAMCSYTVLCEQGQSEVSDLLYRKRA